MWKYFEISNISNNISPDILFQRVLSNVLFNTCVYFYSLCGWEKVHVEKHVLPSSVSLFFSLFSFSSFFFSFFVFSTGTKLSRREQRPCTGCPSHVVFSIQQKITFREKEKTQEEREERKEKRERGGHGGQTAGRTTSASARERDERERRETRDERRERNQGRGRGTSFETTNERTNAPHRTCCSRHSTPPPRWVP